MNKRLNFGAGIYEEPNDPSEYKYAYLFVWTAEFIKRLGNINLSFEPYMVNSGEWYVISANVIDEKLSNMADVILSVKDRVVEKCQVVVEGKSAGNVEYSDVFLSLVRNKISYIPPDLQSARLMVSSLLGEEKLLITRLAQDFGIERKGVESIRLIEMSTVWDAMVRLKESIIILQRLIKACEDLSDDQKGAAVTKTFLEFCKIPTQSRQQSLGNEPKQIN